MRLFYKTSYLLLLLLLVSTEKVNSQSEFSRLYKQSLKQSQSGNYTEALDYNLKALKLAEATNNCHQIAYAYNQVGKMYYYLKDKKSALQFFLSSYEKALQCPADSTAIKSIGNVGVIYQESGKLDSALYYYGVAEKILKRSGTAVDFTRLYAVLADMYINHFKNAKKAKFYIALADTYAVKSGELERIAFVNMKYGFLYQLENNLPLALIHFEKALAQYKQAGFIDGQMYALGCIAKVLSDMKRPGVLKVMQRLSAMKDSIFSKDASDKLADYKTRYQTELKEKENKLLQQQNNINKLELENKTRTIWILVVVAVLIALFVLWRINAGNLKKKQEQLESAQKLQSEKERISRDLHDNVGGQLSYVLFSLEGKNGADLVKQPELINTIQSTVKNVIGNLRETIWAINDENIQLDDFSDKLKVYTRNIFRYTNTQVTFTENINSNSEINSVTGLNLFRICQEVIHNAFKHAKAKNLKIHIESTEKISITISDDGLGFNQTLTGSSGFGLSNIQSRAKEINAALELDSKPNHGTSYKIVV
jgi:signal transduction histidine kinase